MRAKSYGFMLSLLRRYQVQKTIRVTLLIAFLRVNEEILTGSKLQALRLPSFQARITQQSWDARLSVISLLRFEAHLALLVQVEPLAEQVVMPLFILRLHCPLTLRQARQLAL